MNAIENGSVAEQAEAIWAKHYHDMTWPKTEYTWRDRVEDILEGTIIDAKHIGVLLGAAAETANADPDTQDHWMIDQDYVADCVGALASAEWQAFNAKYPGAMLNIFTLAMLADRAVSGMLAPAPNP